MMQRRHFMAGLAFGLALTPGRARAGSSPDPQALLALLNDRTKAAGIGAAWLRQDGGKTTPQTVLETLTDSLRRQGWDGDADTDDLRSRYAAAVRADYAAGAVETVDGWRIARTQAELCALAYFANAGLP